MKFTNTKTNLFLILIIILGFLLRIINLDKFEGLWNDEYVSYMIASIPYEQGFFKEMFLHCHMPFYYLYLKLFMLVGDSDLILRFSSVVAGLLSIIAMFFAGKACCKDKEEGKEEGKTNSDKNFPLLCALLTCTSAFLIYYSQEVRLYTILFLFSSLNLIATIKLLRYQKPQNIIFYLLTAFLILFTHTIGIIYVGFNLLFVSIALFKTNKKQITILWCGLALLFSLFIPQIISILKTKAFVQWWGNFSFAQIGFLFTDYFSPILTNLVNSPNNFFYDKSPVFIVFGLIPTAIGLLGIISALRKKNLTRYVLFATTVATVITLVILAKAGMMVFITKYSMEIYPTLILLSAYGLYNLKSQIAKKALISVLILLNLIYIPYPNSAVMKPQPEGHRLIALLLEKTNAKNGDYVILNYYDKDRFKKYTNFNNYNFFSINKANFPLYIDSEITYEDTLKDGKNLYKNTFINQTSIHLTEKLNNDVFSKMKNGDKLHIITLDSVSWLNNESLDYAVKNPNIYEKIPFLFFVFSYLKNNEIKSANEYLKPISDYSAGNWHIYTFEK